MTEKEEIQQVNNYLKKLKLTAKGWLNLIAVIAGLTFSWVMVYWFYISPWLTFCGLMFVLILVKAYDCFSLKIRPPAALDDDNAE